MTNNPLRIALAGASIILYLFVIAPLLNYLTRTRYGYDNTRQLKAMERQAQRLDGNRIGHSPKRWLLKERDWDEYQHISKPCPNCLQGTLYEKEGKIATVHHCRNCGFSGALTKYKL